MSGYLDPEGIEEFFDFMFELEETRLDCSTSLYCKIVEATRESFIHYPAFLVVVNEETLHSIQAKLKELNLIADVTKDTKGFESVNDSICVTIKNIKQQEQQ